MVVFSVVMARGSAPCLVSAGLWPAAPERLARGYSGGAADGRPEACEELTRGTAPRHHQGNYSD